MKRAAEWLTDISYEPEMSIPDTVLSLYDSNELIAYARMPTNEVNSEADFNLLFLNEQAILGFIL